LRFFFGKTLGRLDLAHQLARVDYPNIAAIAFHNKAVIYDL
jgi:hypothetical protein